MAIHLHELAPGHEVFFDENNVLISEAQFACSCKTKKCILLTEKLALTKMLNNLRNSIDQLHTIKTYNKDKLTREERKKLEAEYQETRMAHGHVYRSLHALENVLLRYLHEDEFTK